MYFITIHLSSARKLARAICPHGRLVTEHLDSRFMITVARHINGLSWVAEEDFIINADRVYRVWCVSRSLVLRAAIYPLFRDSPYGTVDWDAVAHSYRAQLKGTAGIPSCHQIDVGDNHMRSLILGYCEGNCQEGLLEKWFMAEHLPHISVPSVQLPSNTDEAVETTGASHHQGTPDIPDLDQAELPLDAFANLSDALIELEKDDEINSTLHALNHSPREVTRRNNFTLPEVNQSGKIVLSGDDLLFAGIMDLDDGESTWLGSYEVGEDVPSGMQEPDEEDGFATAIQLASDEFD